MITTAKIVRYNGTELLLLPDGPIERDLLQKQADTVEIRIRDGREISPEQRKKIFAIIRDIAVWSGHEPEYLRRFMTWDFICGQDIDWFSLSSVDMTTAGEFITYLIEFCFTHNVPTRDTLLNQTDDIGKYLYMCLEHRKCAVCNIKADIHHHGSQVGAGRNRKKIIHEGMDAIALCRIHHNEAHAIGWKSFNDKYHVYGIKLDKHLCECLNLKSNTKGVE